MEASYRNVGVRLIRSKGVHISEAEVAGAVLAVGCGFLESDDGEGRVDVADVVPRHISFACLRGAAPLCGQSVHQGLGDHQMSGLVGVDRFWAEGVGVAVLELPLEDVVQAH